MIRFFSFDLDGTLLGELNSCEAFLHSWNILAKDASPFLCYNTGRTVKSTLLVADDYRLPCPDFVISEVGTKIYNVKEKQYLEEFVETLVEGWDLQLVERVIQQLNFGQIPQPEEVRNQFKASWYLDDATPEQISLIKLRLKEAGAEANVVYSGSHYLDILPKRANKGHALSWLLMRLQVSPKETLVAGDSGNDIAMFLLEDVKGIVVANALPELYNITNRLSVYHAKGRSVDGVLEGLTYYGVFK